MSSEFKKVVQEAKNSWMNIDGVVTVGQGKQDQTDCIDVYIAMYTDEIKEQIPSVYKEVPVVFRESGGPFVPPSK